MGIAENHAREREQARLDGIVEGLCIAKAIAESLPAYLCPAAAGEAINKQIWLRTAKPVILKEPPQHEPHILEFKRV